MSVAVIGTGSMGGAIALRLLREGHGVVVWNRSPDRALPLAREGAVVVATAEEACREPIVLSMLADDRAMDEVFFSRPIPFGAGSVHISAGTVSVACAERLTAMHASRGEVHVAGPVLGRPRTAEAGQLVILAAGADAALERCRPLFEAIGQRLHVVGGAPWMAHFAKLAANLLLASALEALSEVAVLLDRGGIDRKSFLGLLADTAFACPAYRTYAELVANRRVEPAGFRMRHGLKDVELALAAGVRFNARLPLAELVGEGLREGIARGYADLDWSALALVREAPARASQT
jgi:3-hydroxyisobutyrate dehydrogenase-like beta-hydroxyacid dehydrogenase